MFASVLAALTLLLATVAAGDGAAVPVRAYPPADRPVAEIVAPIWNEAEYRDKADESAQLVRALGIGPGMTVADIGAGSGYHTTRLSPIVGPKGRVFAQDVKSQYLDDLRETVQDLKNVTIVAGDPDDPRLPPRSTEIAILVHMYHEIASPYAFMARLSGAIKLGGKVAIVDMDKPTHRHGTPPNLLRCELAAVGYTEISFHELEGGIGYLAVFTPPAEIPPPQSVAACRNPDQK